jgi:hypothetical protein
MANHGLVPGMRVRLSGAPEWGIGQVQSAQGPRVVVTFEHAGKRVIDADRVTLTAVAEDEQAAG